jgi:hypothetical protein
MNPVRPIWFYIYMGISKNATCHCEQSEAISFCPLGDGLRQSNNIDCFVASLLAMTFLEIAICFNTRKNKRILYWSYQFKGCLMK